jgi:hypothetical protein
MILRLPRNLNTLQAIIDSALPALQLQPSIRAVGEKQRVAGKPLAGLRVEFFGGGVVALFESFVALLFESVGGCLGHEASFWGVLLGWAGETGAWDVGRWSEFVGSILRFSFPLGQCLLLQLV